MPTSMGLLTDFSVAPSLAAPSPAKAKSNETAAKSSVTLDETQPTTSVQIRLADGARYQVAHLQRQSSISFMMHVMSLNGFF